MTNRLPSWESLRPVSLRLLSKHSPDFFLPLNSEPLVEVDADLNKYDTHWLDLIGVSSQTRRQHL